MKLDINNAKFPCKDCPDRHAGCHGVCERYKACVQAHELEKKKRIDDVQFDCYVAKSAARARKARRNHNKL